MKALIILWARAFVAVAAVLALQAAVQQWDEAGAPPAAAADERSA
ncbi:hypothetical protein [Burkholderia stagnalis]|nr:hypothetical protein [Burkholderia stagnalis]